MQGSATEGEGIQAGTIRGPSGPKISYLSYGRRAASGELQFAET